MSEQQPRPRPAEDETPDAHPEVVRALAAAPTEPMPPEVLDGLLEAVRAETVRRADGETTRERAAAISASLERTNRGSYGLNVPRRPTVPHVTEPHVTGPHTSP